MQDLLSSAIALQQTGQLGPAAQLYQKILSQEQENADALHLLGVLHHQKGEHSRAVELIGRAVALLPNVPSFHANLAEAYRALGQFERAAGCCRTALRLWPDCLEALCNLGLALQGKGQHAQAVEQFRRALQLEPNLAIAHSNLGISLRELGQFDEALTSFRRAVELNPQSPQARTNLGQMLIDHGQAEEALPHCLEAVRLQPDLAPIHHNLGNALRALGKFVEARAAFLEAIRLDPNLAQSYAHLGLVLQQDGQLGDALVWLKQAVDLKPHNATFWEYLAELYGEREEPAEAIPCWEQVLILDPARPTAHNGIGWALQEEGRLAEAGEHYRTALRLKPDFAGAQVSLGGLHEELGDLVGAEADFREALRLQQTFALPHARLATLLRGKLSDTDRVALEARLADPQLDEGPRARLLFALAHVLDAQGDFGRAADCLRRANALNLELARRQKREYTPSEHERFVDNVLAGFGPDWFGRFADCGVDSRRPVFIFGLPRSGTTLIEQVLASHSRVHGAGELRLVRQTFEAIPAAMGRTDGPMLCLPHINPHFFRRLAEQHLERLAPLDGRRAERVVDKMPDNYMYLGLLAALFPQAVFIHCRRELRDVAVSCWMTDFRSILWASDLGHIAARCSQYRRLMNHWRTVLPVTLHEVDYEESVGDIEGVARRLVAACGLDWEPACLDFHRTRRPIRTASVAQVRQPIYKQSVARWKNYERELADLFAALPHAEE